MSWDEEVAASFEDHQHDTEVIFDLDYADGFSHGVLRGARWQRNKLRAAGVRSRALDDRSLVGLAEDAGCDPEWVVKTVLDALLGDS